MYLSAVSQVEEAGMKKEAIAVLTATIMSLAGTVSAGTTEVPRGTAQTSSQPQQSSVEQDANAQHVDSKASIGNPQHMETADTDTSESHRADAASPLDEHLNHEDGTSNTKGAYGKARLAGDRKNEAAAEAERAAEPLDIWQRYDKLPEEALAQVIDIVAAGEKPEIDDLVAKLFTMKAQRDGFAGVNNLTGNGQAHNIVDLGLADGAFDAEKLHEYGVTGTYIVALRPVRISRQSDGTSRVTLFLDVINSSNGAIVYSDNTTSAVPESKGGAWKAAANDTALLIQHVLNKFKL